MPKHSGVNGGLRRGRGRLRGAARILKAVFGEGIVLPDQAGELGERIVAGRASGRGTRRTTHGRLTGTDGSLDTVVRHSVPGFYWPAPNYPARYAVRRIEI